MNRSGSYTTIRHQVENMVELLGLYAELPL